MKMNEENGETQALVGLIKPFVSREKIRGTTPSQIQIELEELIEDIIKNVFTTTVAGVGE